MALFLVYLRNYWYLKLTRIASSINGLVYFIRKLPLVGEKIPVGLYKIYPIKQIVTLIFFIISVFFGVIMKFIWLTVFVGFVFILQNGTNSLGNLMAGVDQNLIGNGLFIWFFIVVIFTSFSSNVTFSVERKVVDFYSHFQLSKADVIRGESIIDSLYQGVMYLPVALIVGVLTENLFFVPLFVFLSYLAFQYLFLYFGRMIYTWQWSNRNRIIFIAVIDLLIVVMGAGFYYFQMSQAVMAFFLSGFGVVFLLLLLFISLWLFLNFNQEEAFLIYLSEQATLQGEKIKEAESSNNQYLREGLSMQKKLVLNGDNTFQNLSGSEYLNALLFSRYRPILNKALRLRFYFIGLAWVLVIIASLMGAFKQITSDNVGNSLPFLFFVMYLATFGKKVVQMVFVNCDISMLYYPFYREPSTIIAGFNYRFKQTFYYNSIFSAGIFIFYLLIHVMNGFLLDWQFFGVLVLLLIALSFLFSFHELFIYYMLQPFTGDMSVVSPLYKFVSWLLYWISYANMQVSSIGYLYVVVVSMVSLIYVLIGFMVVYKKAPKTFKIKD